MATYDIFSYAQRNGNPALLLTPQRCGSSFTKKIIENLKPHERNYLTWLTWERNHSPGRNLDQVLMLKNLYIPQRYWHHRVNRSATWFNPKVKINLLYRSPTARYLSGLHFLNGGWADLFMAPIRDWAKENSSHEDQEIIDVLMKVLGRKRGPYYDGNEYPESESWFMQEFENHAVIPALNLTSAGTIHNLQDPVFDFTFGESHLEPAMLWCAFIACMYEYSDFVLLEQYTDWVQDNIVQGTPVTDVDGEEQLSLWKTGRRDIKDSKYVTEQSKAMMDVMIKHFPEFTQEPDTERDQLINWSQWINIEEEVFDFVHSHNGKFCTPDAKRQLIEYLIDLCDREDMCILKDFHLLYWITLKESMQRLPDDLRKAVQRNIGRATRKLCDGPFNWAAWSKW